MARAAVQPHLRAAQLHRLRLFLSIGILDLYCGDLIRLDCGGLCDGAINGIAIHGGCAGAEILAIDLDFGDGRRRANLDSADGRGLVLLESHSRLALGVEGNLARSCAGDLQIESAGHGHRRCFRVALKRLILVGCRLGQGDFEGKGILRGGRAARHGLGDAQTRNLGGIRKGRARLSAQLYGVCSNRSAPHLAKHVCVAVERILIEFNRAILGLNEVYRRLGHLHGIAVGEHRLEFDDGIDMPGIHGVFTIGTLMLAGLGDAEDIPAIFHGRDILESHRAVGVGHGIANLLPAAGIGGQAFELEVKLLAALGRFVVHGLAHAQVGGGDGGHIAIDAVPLTAGVREPAVGDDPAGAGAGDRDIRA